jgi:putative sigma-54 modulation protein
LEVFVVEITITGRHMHVHESVKEYALEKTQKLERFNDALQHIEIVIANEGDRKLVEMIATARVGGKHVGQVEHEDIFAAIDLLIDKMKRQLEKTKEKRKNRKHGESQRGRGADMAPRSAKSEGEELETYDDVIEKMEL